MLRAGPGCVRRRGPRITRVIVTCGAPSKTHVNSVTMKVKLGGGDDTFVAAPWDDVQPRIIADGGAGNDTIFGSTNSDDIDGGPGDDRLYGLDDVDDIDGGDGADLIVGGAGDDGLVGGAGSDTVYGDELSPTTAWGNDLLTAVDFGPDRLSCGEGVDAAVVDVDDAADPSCENLAGGQTTPPRDTVGVAAADGRDRHARGHARAASRGSCAASRSACRSRSRRPRRSPRRLEVSAAEARRLGLPSRERIIADTIGTPLTLTPLTLNTQIRLRWPVRRYLTDEDRVAATLTIVAESVTGARTTASKSLTLRR